MVNALPDLPSDDVVVDGSWFYRLLRGGLARVRLSGWELHAYSRSGAPEVTVPVLSVEEITGRRGWLWYVVTVRTADGRRLRVGGCDRQEVQRFSRAVAFIVSAYAEGWGRELRRLAARMGVLLNGDSYVRHSVCSDVPDLLREVVGHRGRLAREGLEPPAKTALQNLSRLAPPGRFEEKRSTANGRFLLGALPKVRAASRRVLDYPLTDEQAQAVATDEDATLVLAGAGTGKSAVIVGKVAHLVRNLRVPPARILVLAYNKEAALQLERRLRPSLSEVEVFTFHSFGNRVIRACGTARMVSKLAEDDTKLNKTINNILQDLLADPQQSATVINFVLYHHKPYRSVYQFETIDEYEAYVRSVELRTLSGDLVRSFEELAIANYLTTHGVRFRYEQPYPFPTADLDRRQYQPDFYLPDHDIYIEHFALDKEGNPPGHWVGYGAEVDWKRQIHRAHGTTLVETSSWQHSQGVLFQTLRTRLEKRGVCFTPIPTHQLIQHMTSETVSRLTGQLFSFLNHAKSHQLTIRQLRERARHRADRQRCHVFLSVYQQVRDRYQHMLAEEPAIDFHDMINHATSHVQNRRWVSPYRYVLVDEFQDISKGRLDLLQAVADQHPQTACFLVGDDWQSIYRFTGSDVGLVTNCGNYLGHTQQRNLTKTYRFANGILGPSTAFVQRNPDQTQRPLTTETTSKDHGITIIYNPNQAQGVQQALDRINTISLTPNRPCCCWAATTKAWKPSARHYSTTKTTSITAPCTRPKDEKPTM